MGACCLLLHDAHERTTRTWTPQRVPGTRCYDDG